MRPSAKERGKGGREGKEGRKDGGRKEGGKGGREALQLHCSVEGREAQNTFASPESEERLVEPFTFQSLQPSYKKEVGLLPLPRREFLHFDKFCVSCCFPWKEDLGIVLQKRKKSDQADQCDQALL